ncbi:MAG TPA: hypothetical protein V6C71_20940 [Coleofasciculaceae cyanobacterium]|jgi:hypothetical protein
MWKPKRELINDDRIHKISIFTGDKQITYSEVIELWQRDNNFRDFFISLLADTPMTAYFWETPPVTKSTVEREFEFVLIDSPKLADLEPDPSDFRQHFESATSEVITFPNLGNDALLVVPCPITDIPESTHLANFVRNAPESQQHLLWQTVGRELQQRLNEQPIWVSTSGLGVHWLHVRLDSQPKYYCFEPYKQRSNPYQ